MSNATNKSITSVDNIISYGSGAGQSTQGIAIKAFVVNLAVGLIIFALQIAGFFLLKSSALGRRI